MSDSDQETPGRGLSRRDVITRGLTGAGVATLAWSNPLIKTVALGQTNGSPAPAGCMHSALTEEETGCMEACKSLDCQQGGDCNEICHPACHDQEGKDQNECDCPNRCNPDCWECVNGEPTFKGCEANCAA